MAGYNELFDLRNNSNLLNRSTVAVVIEALSIRDELGSVPDHTRRLAWAKLAISDPITESRKMLWALLADNKDLTVAQITGAQDAALQTAVSNTVNLLLS